MDDKQITDRVDAGNADAQEIQATYRVDGSRRDAVGGMPAAARGPRVRWWSWLLLALILSLAGAAVGVFQFADLNIDAATRVVFTMLSCVAACFLLVLWFILFTGLRWRTRLLVAGALAVVLVALGVLFKIDGATGDMGLRLSLRFGAPRDAGLPPLPEGVANKAWDAAIRLDDFPQFLGPNRDGVIHDVALDRDWAAHPPREVWRKDVGAGWSSFAVAGALAVTQEQRGPDELIVARNRADGEIVWWHANPVRFSEMMGGDGPRGTPTIAPDGNVYALGATGILDCLDAATGKLNWTRNTLAEARAGNLDWAKSCSPLVIDDLKLVVVSLGKGGDGALAAYDVKGGKLKWIAGHDTASYASPMLATLAGQRQIVMVNKASVTGHDPADGHVLWDYPWKDAPAKASQPIVLPGDRLLVTAGYIQPGGVLLQVKSKGDNLEVEKVWTTNHMRTKFTTAVVRDHYVYGLDDGNLACINLDDEGSTVWQADRGHHYGHGQVLLVDDLLIVQAETGEVALVSADPSGFHVLGAVQPFKTKTWNNPALAGRYLFVRNDEKAVCYELAAVKEK